MRLFFSDAKIERAVPESAFFRRMFPFDFLNCVRIVEKLVNWVSVAVSEMMTIVNDTSG